MGPKRVATESKVERVTRLPGGGVMAKTIIIKKLFIAFDGNKNMDMIVLAASRRDADIFFAGANLFPFAVEEIDPCSEHVNAVPVIVLARAEENSRNDGRGFEKRLVR